MSVTIHNGNSLFLTNYATQIICFVAVTPFVALRILVRWRLNHSLGIDDGMSRVIHFEYNAWLTTQLVACWDG